MKVSESLAVVEGDDGKRFGCLRCGQDLGSVAENYKHGCLIEETDVLKANPHIGDPHRYVDADIVFRRFYCPSCAVLIETEIAHAQDPPLWDIEIAP